MLGMKRKEWIKNLSTHFKVRTVWKRYVNETMKYVEEHNSVLKLTIPTIPVTKSSYIDTTWDAINWTQIIWVKGFHSILRWNKKRIRIMTN